MNGALCFVLLSMVMLDVVLGGRFEHILDNVHVDIDALDRIFSLGCFHKHGQFCKEMQRSCCKFFKALYPDADVNSWDLCANKQPKCSWDFLKTDKCMNYDDEPCTCV